MVYFVKRLPLVLIILLKMFQKQYRLIIFLALTTQALWAQTKILFDASKAESAGNADWVIDADTFNLRWTSVATFAGTESNAQRIPSPAQANITATTPETYWKGAISAWGIDCVKKGFTVETLPYNGRITFNDATNSQDLSNYKVFVVCEPNIAFTMDEKVAIVAYVKSGGGLFMVGDHLTSDRNNDGKDSPVIWNDLMSNNGSVVNPFGIAFENNDIGNNFSNNLAQLPSDNPLLYGSMGSVTQLAFHAGSSIAINKTANPTAYGVVYQSGVSNTGTTGMMCAAATYGKGRVVALGDSSVPDDGTGDTGDNLYNGYTGDAYASDNGRRLVMNATLWLAANTNLVGTQEWIIPSLFVHLNSAIVSDVLQFEVSHTQDEMIHMYVFDAFGCLMVSRSEKILRGPSTQSFIVEDLPVGVYFLNVLNKKGHSTKKFVKQ
jgi:hypothetical protein